MTVNPWQRPRDEVAARALTEPNADHFPPTHPGYEQALAAHAAALAEGDSRYVDPLTGAQVMTALGHLKRGWCCQLWCRHCPYRG